MPPSPPRLRRGATRAPAEPVASPFPAANRIAPRPRALAGAAALALAGLALAAPAPARAYDAGLVAPAGCNFLPGQKEVDTARRLGATLLRVEFCIDRRADELRSFKERADAAGIELLLLANMSGGGWMPSRARAESLAEWARAFGPGGRWSGRRPVRAIQFLNEPSYTYRNGGRQPSYGTARTYGERYADASRAVAATNGGVAVLPDGGDSHNPDWVRGLIDGAGGAGRFRELVDRAGGGVAVHAYGPPPGFAGGDGGSRYGAILGRLMGQYRERGVANPPLWITEDGIATRDGRCLDDNYRWPRCMSFTDAAEGWRRKADHVRGTWRPRVHIFYTTYDRADFGSGTSHREDWYGALKRDGSDKGPLTGAVRDWLTRHPR